MKNVNLKKEVIRLTKETLVNMGVASDVIESIIKDVNDVLMIRLPKSNLFKENREGTGNQSHIAVTGEAQQFFFDKETIANPTESEFNWKKYKITLFQSNIAYLKNRAINKNHTYSIEDNDDEIVDSYTNVKIGRIESPPVQVQVGYRRGDDANFNNLRKGLFKDDLLIFIKCGMGDALKVIVVGLSSEDFASDIISAKNLYLHDEVIKTVDLSSAEGGTPIRKGLRDVDYTTIAMFNPTDEDETDTKVYSKSGVKVRQTRTQRHQNIVRMAAQDMQRAGYKLQEGTVDLLAKMGDANREPVLFEVKTLNGTHADEVEQVRKAFAQLLYYEMFDVKEKVKKVALFESEISEEHIGFLEKYDVQAIWMGKDEESAFFFDKSGKRINIDELGK